MPTITALLPQPRKRHVTNLFLEGAFAFSLHRSLAQEAGLFIGQELSSQEAQALMEREDLQDALEAAYRYLTHRPRSEAEVRSRLRRRKVAAATIDQVLTKLKEQHLLDDAAFARQWTENRATHSPRSRGLVRWELRQKGVSQELAQEAVQEIDDEESAYQAGVRRASRTEATDYQEFRKRLGDFLLRRGFGYAVAGRAVERLWREQQEYTDGQSSERIGLTLPSDS